VARCENCEMEEERSGFLVRGRKLERKRQRPALQLLLFEATSTGEDKLVAVDLRDDELCHMLLRTEYRISFGGHLGINFQKQIR